MLILRPDNSIIPSEAKFESVRMAFDVVIFDRLAISSLDKEIRIVFPSASNP